MARSRGELMETVTPVLTPASRMTRELSTPSFARNSRHASPQESQPSLPVKDTSLPSLARPAPRSAPQLPSVNVMSSTSVDAGTAERQRDVLNERFLAQGWERKVILQDQVEVQLA